VTVEALQVLVCYLLVLDAACVPAGFGPPPTTLDDCRRFPDHATAAMLTRRAHDHWHRCRDHQAVTCDEQAWFRARAEEAYRAWYMIDDVRLASNRHTSDEERVEILTRLRRWLGEEAWHAGALPAPVPLWACGN
jgi:hypothetical protein